MDESLSYIEMVDEAGDCNGKEGGGGGDKLVCKIAIYDH
jgi:hypothetical protein